MVNNKAMQAFIEEVEDVAKPTMAPKPPQSLPSPPSSSPPRASLAKNGAQKTSGTTEKGKKSAKQIQRPTPSINQSPPASPPPLIISRNKHWRYISSFHGPWLQVPVEVMETIAHINYNAARPRPIDPALFFDLAKIRRLVDEATNLAVRAASDIASPTLTSVNGGLPSAASMTCLEHQLLPQQQRGGGLGNGAPAHVAKLSPERKFRMREQASQKLASAYRLDEVACSVATMQGSTPVDEVGGLVLQRKPDDLDAKYVHFFQEKIPSLHLAESTSAQPIRDVMEGRPHDAALLRTCAMVRNLKEAFEMAIIELTQALSVVRAHEPSHDAPGPEGPQRERKRAQEVILAAKDQPTSLEGQLLFQRATTYLNLASNWVLDSLPSAEVNTAGQPEPSSEGASGKTDQKLEPPDQDDARKLVKSYAKKGIRDYMAFIAQFEYSPNMPIKLPRNYNDRVSLAAHNVKNTKLPVPDPDIPGTPHKVYSLADLFKPVPPTDLPMLATLCERPPYCRKDPYPKGICEVATFHPLLSEALHSLLLCHCLAQTSIKELQRHAVMAARVLRLADGYPLFQPSRSPARSDWVEVLLQTDDWLRLGVSWEQLCTPAPLPIYDFPRKDLDESDSDDGTGIGTRQNREAARAAARKLASGTSAQEVAQEQQQNMSVRNALEQFEKEFYRSVIAKDKEVAGPGRPAAAATKSQPSSSASPPPTAGGSGDKSNSETAPARMWTKAGPACHHHHDLHHYHGHSHGHDHGTSHVNQHDHGTIYRNPAYTGSSRGARAAAQRWPVEDIHEYPLVTDRATYIAEWVTKAPLVTGVTRKKKRTKKPAKAGKAAASAAAGGGASKESKGEE